MNSSPVVAGRIRRRVLVNALVDRAEAAWLASQRSASARNRRCNRRRLLPAGARGRAHAAAAARAVRPLHAGGGAPNLGRVGRRAGRADRGGVCAERVDTDSSLAVAAGGRWFPGVHRRARLGVADTPARGSAGRCAAACSTRWQLRRRTPRLLRRMTRSPAPASMQLWRSRPAGAVGSRARGMRMASCDARALVTDTLESTFLASIRFGSAGPRICDGRGGCDVGIRR